MEGTTYSPNVIRDCIRCKCVETLFPNKLVHSINICSDNVRDSDNISEFEMNCKSNNRRFIQEMECKN